MTKKYYTLRYERDDAFHKAGEKVYNDKNTLHIGPTTKVGNSSGFRLLRNMRYA